MLVVSDTTPINYLILIGAIDVLPALYGIILVPSQIIEELQQRKTSDQVRAWISELPGWVEVRAGDPSRFPALDAGEAAALALAVDAEAELLVDDAEARTMAQRIGVATVGTVGILVEAHLASLLNFEAAIESLQKTNFHIHVSVIDAARQTIQREETG